MFERTIFYVTARLAVLRVSAQAGHRVRAHDVNVHVTEIGTLAALVPDGLLKIFSSRKINIFR